MTYRADPDASNVITVTCDLTGDTAEADTPEAAVAAARTLIRDAFNANAHGRIGLNPTCTFTGYDGVIRRGVGAKGLSRA